MFSNVRFVGVTHLCPSVDVVPSHLAAFAHPVGPFDNVIDLADEIADIPAVGLLAVDPGDFVAPDSL